MPILDHKQCYHGIFRKLSREEVSTWDRKWFARLSWWLSWDENQLSPIKISLSWDTEIIITRQERNIIHSVVSNVNMTKLHNSVCRLSGPFERVTILWHKFERMPIDTFLREKCNHIQISLKVASIFYWRKTEIGSFAFIRINWVTLLLLRPSCPVLKRSRQLPVTLL